MIRPTIPPHQTASRHTTASLPNLSDTLEPDEAETPAPKDEAALAAAKLADQTLASMTLDEKLWQLFFVTPEAITKVETATLAGEATKAAIESQPVGGLVYFAKNLENRAQTVTLLENSQSYSKIPLFLGVDEEGGTVSRLKTSGLDIDTGVGTMQSIGETADPAAAYAAGQEIAGNLHALGFNLDFAPVTDVSSGKNAAIGSRSVRHGPGTLRLDGRDYLERADRRRRHPGASSTSPATAARRRTTTKAPSRSTKRSKNSRAATSFRTAVC